MNTSTWRRQQKLTLVALPNAPYWARRFTEDVLNKWDAKELRTNALLVVSEFVTNAMKATTSLDEAMQQAYIRSPMAVSLHDLNKMSCIVLRLSFEHGWLLVEVADESTDPPEERLPDFVSEDGRGLFVVSAFCERWGYYPSEGGGKVVWGELVQP